MSKFIESEGFLYKLGIAKSYNDLYQNGKYAWDYVVAKDIPDAIKIYRSCFGDVNIMKVEEITSVLPTNVDCIKNLMEHTY